MLQNFLSYISREKLLDLNQSVLLSVSGGIDSMVMCHLFLQSNYQISIAHIDHHTRNGESSLDAAFVKEFAALHNMPYYESSFNHDPSKNFQAEARAYRYDFLEGIRKKHGIDKIATAHHKNDVAESVIMNISRGAGLLGMSGISALKDQIIRPLLFTDKESIVAYALKENINYREDKSNKDEKYSRNAIRYQIIPKLEKINERAVNNIFRTTQNINNELLLIKALIENQKEDFVLSEEEDVYILRLDKIKSFTGSHSLLMHLCAEYTFNQDQISSILTADTGAQFYSEHHSALVNRARLIIQPITNWAPIMLTLEKEGLHIIDEQKSIILKMIDVSDVDYGSEFQYIDFSKTAFPLRLRSWQSADTFCPLGMDGQHQKVQDFFVNNKFSKLQKREALLLITPDDQIAAITGYRIDERFKIDHNTTSALAFKILAK